MFGHIFVYGTLKSGQERALLWPALPVQVRRAWTLGTLYDMGPYPALTRGSARVAGQLWTLAEQDLPLTFQVLDAIEGTDQPGYANEYDREQTLVYLESGEPVCASVYFYAQPERLAALRPMAARLEWQQERYCIWPKDASWDV